MRTQITTKLLQDISRDIHHGKAIWGLLRANEYLDNNNPIRKALSAKARQNARELAETELFDEIASGKTLLELPEEMQSAVYNLQEQSRQRPRVVVKPAFSHRERKLNGVQLLRSQTIVKRQRTSTTNSNKRAI